MTTEKAVARRQPEGVALTGVGLIDVHQLNIIQANIELLETRVKAMLRPGQDYGRLPGMQKDTLFDSGAGTIRAVYNIYPDQEIILHEENSEGIRYVLKVKGIHRDTGQVVASGVGSASSGEMKYAYRWVSARDLGNQPKEGLKTKPGYGGATLYRIDNPDIPDLDNTLLKMAAKRAEVDMTLQLPGVSRVFTQDIGDKVKVAKGPGEIDGDDAMDALDAEALDGPSPTGRGPQEAAGGTKQPQAAPQGGPGASRPALETTGRVTKTTYARLEALWAEQTKLPNFAAIREDLARAWKARQERLELTGLMTEAQAQDWIADIEKEQKGK